MRSRTLCLVLAVAVSGLFACATRQPLPDDGFVDVPGGRIAFRVIGGGDGVPVLFIHGGPGGTSCSYVGTVDGIASSRAVVFYDQLGSGNSDRMRDMEWDALCRGSWRRSKGFGAVAALAQALERGYSRSVARDDGDLAALRGRSDYQSLVATTPPQRKEER